MFTSPFPPPPVLPANLLVLGRTITVPQELLDALAARQAYLPLIKTMTERFSLGYDEIGNPRAYLDHGRDLVEDLLADLSTPLVTSLVEGGQYEVTLESFLEEVETHSWMEALDRAHESLLEGYAAILEDEEERERIRANRQAGRFQLSGGGFGVAGAAKGIAMAGIFNIASAAVVGSINLAGKAVSAVGNHNKNSQLYVQMRSEIATGVFCAGLAVCDTYYSKLREGGAASPQGIELIAGYVSKAQARFKNANLDTLSDAARLGCLTEAIAFAPQMEEYQLALGERLGEEPMEWARWASFAASHCPEIVAHPDLVSPIAEAVSEDLRSGNLQMAETWGTTLTEMGPEVLKEAVRDVVSDLLLAASENDGRAIELACQLPWLVNDELLTARDASKAAQLANEVVASLRSGQPGQGQLTAKGAVISLSAPGYAHFLSKLEHTTECYFEDESASLDDREMMQEQVRGWQILRGEAMERIRGNLAKARKKHNARQVITGSLAQKAPSQDLYAPSSSVHAMQLPGDQPHTLQAADTSVPAEDGALPLPLLRVGALVLAELGAAPALPLSKKEKRLLWRAQMLQDTEGQGAVLILRILAFGSLGFQLGRLQDNSAAIAVAFLFALYGLFVAFAGIAWAKRRGAKVMCKLPVGWEREAAPKCEALVTLLEVEDGHFRGAGSCLFKTWRQACSDAAMGMVAGSVFSYWGVGFALLVMLGLAISKREALNKIKETLTSGMAS